MKIITDEGHILIKIELNDDSLKSLLNKIDDIPSEFRSIIISSLGISKPSFYRKRKANSFTRLEKAEISQLTGLNINKL